MIDARIPMMGRQTNTLAALVGGAQAAQGLQKNSMALQMQGVENKMQAAQMLARGVLGAQDKPGAYAAALKQAGAMGMDVSAFPSEYGPDAEMALRMVAAPAEERSQFERIINEIQDPQERRRALQIHLGLAVDANTEARLSNRTEKDPIAGLRARATEAGLRPGTDEYREYMRNGGRQPSGPTINVNTGNTGIDYGKPPKDMAWQRNRDGTVALDERGAPIPIPLSNTENFQNQEQSVQNADEMLSTIDRFLGHPGFDKVYGLAGVVPNIPGGEAAGARSLFDQLNGKAFLAAFDTLKGGGQITETEGAKATAAITRALDPNISPAEAKEAWGEFKAVVESARARAQEAITNQGQPASQQGNAQRSIQDFSVEELEDMLDAMQ